MRFKIGFDARDRRASVSQTVFSRQENKHIIKNEVDGGSPQVEASLHKIQQITVSSTTNLCISGTMVFIKQLAISAAVVAFCHCTSAWMPPIEVGMRSRGRQLPLFNLSVESRWCMKMNAEKSEVPSDNDEEQAEVDNKPAVEWGVSYIGGDPCGSKYNTDPFDKQPSDKPGMPDDMKARIAALAEKKLQEAREKEN